jgi:hypothetical protein
MYIILTDGKVLETESIKFKSGYFFITKNGSEDICELIEAIDSIVITKPNTTLKEAAKPINNYQVLPDTHPEDKGKLRMFMIHHCIIMPSTPYPTGREPRNMQDM